MKALIITTHLNIGGIGLYTVNLAKYLGPLGVECSVLSSGGDLEPVLGDIGIKHYKFDIKTKSEFGVKMFRSLPGIIDLIKKEKFDLVHAQTRVSQIIACMSGVFTGVPVICTCHGFFNSRRLSRKLFPCWGKRTIAISNGVKEHLMRDFRVPEEKIDMILNGIETDNFLNISAEKDHALMKELDIPSDALVVGTVGRLSEVKGQKYLIKAFKGIIGQFPKARLLLVGEGPEEKELRCLVDDLSISEYVIFEGRMRKKLPVYLRLMDVFCLPSVMEGVGLALMEAMASGCACLASKTGGIPEVVDDGDNGILVTPEDETAIQKALVCLLADPKLRATLGERAREKAMEEFSIKDNIEKTRSSYEKLLAENKKKNGCVHGE
ncbi:MAG TPA: glycosyltransferase family 4 protein [Candidatus Omnitrophota bacterium]|nr:glycosyltransferase family 4 protein [Candidatus Omnitrophota bacterium]HPS19835.1 glycosyltransferase family 4 protein [Candidatus Omnitrophota bacterium]